MGEGEMLRVVLVPRQALVIDRQRYSLQRLYREGVMLIGVSRTAVLDPVAVLELVAR